MNLKTQFRSHSKIRTSIINWALPKSVSEILFKNSFTKKNKEFLGNFREFKCQL